MRPPRLRRLKALLLAALLAGGGGGMPGLDIALFHGRMSADEAHAEARHLGPHYEPDGAPHVHSELCQLGSSFSETSDNLGPTGPSKVLTIILNGEPRLTLRAPSSLYLDLASAPRAPPYRSA